mgnify:CR=1 FL=1
MNKDSLIGAMAEKSGLTRKDCESALNAFIESVSESLAKKEKVTLIGFGTFSVVTRAARRHHHQGNEQHHDKQTDHCFPHHQTSLIESISAGYHLS